MSRRTAYPLARDVLERTRVRYRDRIYSARIDDKNVVVEGGDESVTLGAYCRPAGADSVKVMVSPGSENYLGTHADRPSEQDLAAAAILTAAVGHPDAEADRAGKALSVVWSHHFALVYGDDPRRVAKTFAPTETKTTAWRVQDAAALGVEISDG
jgi:hypothetical protein